jgi:hypothetical protein
MLQAVMWFDESNIREIHFPNRLLLLLRTVLALPRLGGTIKRGLGFGPAVV